MTSVSVAAHGMAVPNRPHAVSVHIHTWKEVCTMALGDTEAIKALENGYPRSYIHKSIQVLAEALRRDLSLPGDKLMLFSNLDAARACKEYMISTAIHGSQAGSLDSISLHTMEFDTAALPKKTPPLPQIHAVVYPSKLSGVATLFWRLTGTGISSRQADRCLQALDCMRQGNGNTQYNPTISHPIYGIIRARIATLIERAPISRRGPSKILPSDVYLYPSGMSAIYHAHHLLLKWRGAESVVVGFTYELTVKTMQAFGPSYRFFSVGTEAEIDELEIYVEDRYHQGIKIQAIWCECPSNPLLRTVNMERLRRLADKYDFVVVVDDTIGNFANVDVLDVADVVITSLTKAFNGFADVLAGSMILNPNSQYYCDLQHIINATYTNNLHLDDALQLEQNSRTFLQRAARMNETANYLVDHLSPYVSTPASIVSKIYYPKLCWSAANYHARMRPATEEFTPGYGGMFTIEFDTVQSATRFFDMLKLHKGPSTGADVTLALPYVQMVFQKEKEWAACHGVKETIVRISVGLEDKEELLSCLVSALEAANKTSSRL
ncbi:hypothetical protein N7457_001275 [Penicillium paradoxum]|uniref:uncharacterized protein n=1 Tax=Penicillium paradoxum TaxID=176176 RepID=UPI0025486530|nr:uncharacterized protein N7457_001275 [Penicillium paradoxum]KAJ5794676.1 hypothetical protein N7457_001275 [Penicillium paradoxum]